MEDPVQDALYKVMTVWSYQVKTINIKNGNLIVSKNDKETKYTLVIAKGISIDVDDIRADAVIHCTNFDSNEIQFEISNKHMKLLSTSNQNTDSIMGIVIEAQYYLASLGIDQWQDGYPQKEIILNDIINTESYIVENVNKETLGTAMFTTNPEPTYSSIEGSWITNKDAKYGVIHRMAVGKKFRNKGVAKFIFNSCEQKLKDKKIPSMRIDTHEHNKGMQGLLKKIGYQYCGIIYLQNGDKRLAFEKLLR